MDDDRKLLLLRRIRNININDIVIAFDGNHLMIRKFENHYSELGAAGIYTFVMDLNIESFKKLLKYLEQKEEG